MTEPVLPGLAVFAAAHQPGSRFYIQEKAWYAAVRELLQAFTAHLQHGITIAPEDWGDGFLFLGRWVMRER